MGWIFLNILGNAVALYIKAGAVKQFQCFDGPCPIRIPDPALLSKSLNHSGNTLSIMNVHKASTNFCNLSGYSSPTTRLPPIAGLLMLARAIISLYYLYDTTYIIYLNLIIYRPSSGNEPGSLGPKAATLPVCYAE